MIETTSIDQRLNFRNEFIARQTENTLNYIDGTVLSDEEYGRLDHLLINLRAQHENGLADRIIGWSDIQRAISLASKEGIVQQLCDRASDQIRKDAEVNGGYHPFVVSDEIDALVDSQMQIRSPHNITMQPFVGMPLTGHERLRDIVTIEWGLKDCMPEVNGSVPSGMYELSERKILIAQDNPSSSDSLTAFANWGHLHPVTDVYYHEWIHAIQFNLGNPDIPAELVEAQAYRAQSAKSYSIFNLSDLLKTSALYEGFDPKKVDFALWTIDRMNALSFTQMEIISNITDPGVWNEEYGLWEDLEVRLQRVIKSRNLNPDGVERAVLIHELRSEIGNARAKIATQKVLLEAFPEVKKNKAKESFNPRQPMAPQRLYIIPRGVAEAPPGLHVIREGFNECI